MLSSEGNNQQPDAIISREFLFEYYKRFFPLKYILKWLCHGNEKLALSHREFSFTLEGDLYTRYLSFDDLKSFSGRLLRDVPIKIDIGAIYNNRPDKRSTDLIKPVQHELVFDIDLSDYNDLRSCCTYSIIGLNECFRDKKICPKCWKFICVAVNILELTLREEFGFNNIFWVFSGRRGVHCWVSDYRARILSPTCRKAIITYIQSIDLKKRTATPYELTPSLQYPALRYFCDIILIDQNILTCPKQRSNILSHIPNEDVRASIAHVWSNKTIEQQASSLEYWKILQDFLSNAEINRFEMARILNEIKVSLLLPKLDTNVTVQNNHLLKMPFCIHPSTGKLCVPFTAEKVDEFNPTSVPTLNSLLNGERKVSLDPFYAIIDDFVSKQEAERSRLRDLKKELDEASFAF